MATNTTPEPTTAIQPSTKLASAINAVVKAEGSLAVALDNYRNVAKSETVRLGLEDKKALTAILFASGDGDARRVSEIVGFVFPASESAHKELDKAMEKNAKETDAKKRIAKPVILALQRDKTGKLTLEQAIKAYKDGSTRQPGGQTNQTNKGKDKKKTPAEIEEELGNLCAAALNFAKANEYDLDDFHAVCEAQEEAVYAEEEEEEAEDKD